MATPTTTTMTLTSGHACPNCGIGLPSPDTSALAAEAQQQIEDLQSQVRLLTAKATAAADKWADYDDEIEALRSELSRSKNLPPNPPNEDSLNPPPSPGLFSNYLPVAPQRFSFLARKSVPNLQSHASTTTPPTPSASDLVAALNREQALRQAAEGKLDEASGELEELSAQLFMQANEMVATERKARAKLEERVEVLERRDGEKRKRLEGLERAVARIERVRGLLVPGR